MTLSPACSTLLLLDAGAGSETRTRTGIRPPPPQDGVSTSSTIPARNDAVKRGTTAPSAGAARCALSVCPARRGCPAGPPPGRPEQWSACPARARCPRSPEARRVSRLLGGTAPSTPLAGRRPALHEAPLDGPRADRAARHQSEDKRREHEADGQVPRGLREERRRGLPAEHRSETSGAAERAREAAALTRLQQHDHDEETADEYVDADDDSVHRTLLVDRTAAHPGSPAIAPLR